MTYKVSSGTLNLCSLTFSNYEFRRYCDFYILAFRFKIAYSCPFRGCFEDIFLLNSVTGHSKAPTARPCAETRHLSLYVSAPGWAVVWLVDRIEKNMDSIKVTKVLYFTSLGRTFPAESICPKISMWSEVSDVITCVKIRFSYLFLNCHYRCSATALPLIYRYFWAQNIGDIDTDILYCSALWPTHTRRCWKSA